jgi:general L-amino acid transport system permease protein
VLLGSWLVDNTLTNLSNQGKTLGFDFLTRTAGFQIIPTLGTWMFDYEVGKSNYIDVYLIGIVNTFAVAFLGIFAATIVGFTIGIMRLSENLVFKGFATAFIEVLRNIPLLLQLFFWYFRRVARDAGQARKIGINSRCGWGQYHWFISTRTGRR